MLSALWEINLMLVSPCALAELPEVIYASDPGLNPEEIGRFKAPSAG